MTKEEFDNLSENLKSDILKEIAYEYTVFVPKDEPRAIKEFKSMVRVMDRRFFDKNVLEIADALIGKNLAPFHPNCNCQIEILGEAETVFYTITNTKPEDKRFGKYLKSSLKQVALGNTYTMGTFG